MNLMRRMEATPPAVFDYSTLPADVASEARAVAERVRDRNRAAVIETGRDLLAIKERLEHGQFIPWLEAEFGMTERTAQNYMRAAAEFGDKPEIISYLPPTTIYALAAPSTPAPVREQVVQRLTSGERLAPAAVADMVREAKVADRKAAERAKLSPEKRKAREAKESRQAQSLARKAEERRIEDEKRKRAAKEAVAFLVERLGGDFPRFAELLGSTTAWGFCDEVKAAAFQADEGAVTPS